MGVCSSTREESKVDDTMPEPTEEELKAELETMKGELRENGGINYESVDGLPTGDGSGIREVILCLEELMTLEAILGINDKFGQECNALRRDLIDRVNEWNRGNTGEATNIQDVERNADENILEEMFEFIPKVNQLKEVLISNKAILETWKVVKLLDSELLDDGAHVALGEIKRQPQYWRWLAELPASFIYKGCRPGMEFEMADSVSNQLMTWGFLFDPNNKLWTKPFWWVLGQVDDLTLRQCAHVRVKNRKVREWGAGGIIPKRDAIIAPM